MRIPISWCCMAIFTAASGVVAQPLYKSVNEHGEVTFSDSPPPNAVKVEEVELPPGPSEAQQQESTERFQRMEQQARELESANSERAQQRQEQQQQAQQRAREKEKNEVQPINEYNNGYGYPRRPLYPPVIRPPVQPGPRPPQPGQPGRPVQLPAGPGLTPGR